MKALNKETAPKAQRPERIIQFGEGNFLRAFVDWIIYNIYTSGIADCKQFLFHGCDEIYCGYALRRTA